MPPVPPLPDNASNLTILLWIIPGILLLLWLHRELWRIWEDRHKDALLKWGPGSACAFTTVVALLDLVIVLSFF